MVKAVFHKNQRVFVTPVGTWASIERVIPQWVKGIDEPLRVHYDCGMGREFDAAELVAEQNTPQTQACMSENWSVFRRQNRWQSTEDSAHHPLPGTHPVVVTSDDARSGWRVPAAEYDVAPQRYEMQARIIAAAPRLMNIAKVLIELTSEYEDELPHAMIEQARRAAKILGDIENSAASLSPGLMVDRDDTDFEDAAPQPQPQKTYADLPTRMPLPVPAPVFAKQDTADATSFVSPGLRRTQPPR